MKIEKRKDRYAAISEEGRTMGQIFYQKDEHGNLDIILVKVQENFQGQGVATSLLNYVVDRARQEDIKIIPTCSFVRSQFEANPDKYADVNNGM